MGSFWQKHATDAAIDSPLSLLYNDPIVANAERTQQREQERIGIGLFVGALQDRFRGKGGTKRHRNHLIARAQKAGIDNQTIIEKIEKGQDLADAAAILKKPNSDS